MNNGQINSIYIGFASELEKEQLDIDLEEVMRWEIPPSGKAVSGTIDTKEKEIVWEG